MYWPVHEAAVQLSAASASHLHQVGRELTLQDPFETLFWKQESDTTTWQSLQCAICQLLHHSIIVSHDVCSNLYTMECHWAWQYQSQACLDGVLANLRPTRNFCWRALQLSESVFTPMQQKASSICRGSLSAGQDWKPR